MCRRCVVVASFDGVDAARSGSMSDARSSSSPRVKTFAMTSASTRARLKMDEEGRVLL